MLLEMEDLGKLQFFHSWYLSNTVKITDEDCDNVVALKATCLAMLEDTFNLHILHKAAVFLNPRQTLMKAMTHSEQQLALDYIADQMESMLLSHHQLLVNKTGQSPQNQF